MEQKCTLKLTCFAKHMWEASISSAAVEKGTINFEKLRCPMCNGLPIIMRISGAGRIKMVKIEWTVSYGANRQKN